MLASLYQTGGQAGGVPWRAHGGSAFFMVVLLYPRDA